MLKNKKKKKEEEISTKKTHTDVYISASRGMTSILCHFEQGTVTARILLTGQVDI